MTSPRTASGSSSPCTATFSRLPTDEGELRQLTEGAARDLDVLYSPDGKSIAFISDQSGREEIHVIAADGAGPARKVTDLDDLKTSARLVARQQDDRLCDFRPQAAYDRRRRQEPEGAGFFQLMARSAARPGRRTASCIAYSKTDVSRSTDIYLIPEQRRRGEEDHVRPGQRGQSPLFRRRHQGLLRPPRGGWQRRRTPVVAALLRAAREAHQRPGRGRSAPGRFAGRTGPGDAPGRTMARAVTPKTPDIDWAGLKRRTRQVTRTGVGLQLHPGQRRQDADLRRLRRGGAGGGGPGGFGGRGGGGTPSIYTIQDNGKRMTRIATGTPRPTVGDDEDRPARHAGRLPRRHLQPAAHQGRPHALLPGRRVGLQHAGRWRRRRWRRRDDGGAGRRTAARLGRIEPRRPAAAPTPAAAAAARSDGSAFNVTVRIDKPQEWDEMFDDAWRCMKYRFYDPKLHGTDWDAMRAKYKPLVAYVADRHELMNVINEMIGELNASHTGASAGRERGAGAARRPRVMTRHLGLDLQADQASGRYKVTHVYEDGPADKDWVKVEKGNYLIAIDGKPVKAGDDYNAFLGRRLNRKVELTFNSKPVPEGAWTVKYEPISMTAFSNLRYDRWVKERRATVDKLSGGRVGYLHIKAMDQPSLAKFKKDLGEFRHKEGLVIDQRWNGGGNIEQELLAILVQRPYEVWQPRGVEPTERPFTGYFGPKVVLQNWRSASNAEMFPAGFRALGLGKVIGTPTMGAVIGTGSYSLIDGSSIRTPGVGVFLADTARTNMENHAVQPDVYVENTPEDNLAGHDRQLETAVREVMKELKPGESVAKSGKG